jgi:curli biogenesis system outer membrane secretion channel CsgG
MKSLGLTLFAALATASATSFAADVSSNVEKCERPLGTIAVSENRGASQHELQSYGLGSPVSLLRIMIQNSNCFTVVERGVAMANLQEERALAANGDSMGNSNIGKGQLQAADFVMTPGVQFTANTGGVGAALSNWGGSRLGGIVGGIAGNLKFKEAQTSLLIADVRSGIQVAAAEGAAKKTDFGMSGWNYASGGYASGSGYTNTPEGHGNPDPFRRSHRHRRRKERLRPDRRRKRGRRLGPALAGVDRAGAAVSWLTRRWWGR